MLVLTRKPREEIRIGNGITITILRVKGQSVRVGIDAPNDVRIVRGELTPESNESEAAESSESLESKPNLETVPVEGSVTNALVESENRLQNETERETSHVTRCERSQSLKSTLHETKPPTCGARGTSSPALRGSSTLQKLVARNRSAAWKQS